MGEDGGLVTGAGAYLKNDIARADAQQVGHQSDDERLRNGLTVADRQWLVSICVAAHSIGHELVPRYIAHDFQYLRCNKVPAERDTRLLRVGLYRRHHAGALSAEIRLRRRGQQTSGNQKRQDNAKSERWPAPRNNGNGRRARPARLRGVGPTRTSPEPPHTYPRKLADAFCPIGGI